MRKHLTLVAMVLAAASALATAAGASAAGTFTQIANIKVLSTTGGSVPKGKGYVLIDSYQATRDEGSLRGNKKVNPAGALFMQFTPGSGVNQTAVGATRVCQESEYATLSILAAKCSKAVVGRGWALIRGDNPVPQAQLPGAPPACTGPDQYSKTWSSNPGAGPDCIPVGSVYTKVTAYQGGVLGSKFWCYGLNWYTQPADSFKGKGCDFKDPGGFAPNIGITGLDSLGRPQPNPLYKASANGCNIIFANDNGVAPLAFGGSGNGYRDRKTGKWVCGNILSVVIPALNGSGSGLGELAGGLVMSDFYLRIIHKTYLKAGACPADRKVVVTTRYWYTKLKGESDFSRGTTPKSPLDVPYTGACRP